MPKHTVFVCKSCHRSSEELPENRPSDGTLLLDNIKTLWERQFPAQELKIESVGCLWACDRGCVVSVCSPEKPTYLFVDLSPQESASALLEFARLYVGSRKGAISWKELPQLLQSAIFAQIPPLEC